MVEGRPSDPCAGPGNLGELKARAGQLYSCFFSISLFFIGGVGAEPITKQNMEAKTLQQFDTPRTLYCFLFSIHLGCQVLCDRSGQQALHSFANPSVAGRG